MAARPCSTCPYRRDTPPGIWAASEYAKLAAYDPQPNGPGPLATFHCHLQTPERPTACRGWLAVHRTDSPAVRLAISMGKVTAEEATAPVVGVELYGSGAEAAAAGLAGVASPSPAAMTAQDRLLSPSSPAGTRLVVTPPQVDDDVLADLEPLRVEAARQGASPARVAELEAKIDRARRRSHV